MTGVGINRRDHPVGGHPAGDAKHAILSIFQILADDGRQQRGGLGGLASRMRPSSTRRHLGVTGQRVDQRLTGFGVVPVDLRLGFET